MAEDPNLMHSVAVLRRTGYPGPTGPYQLLVRWLMGNSPDDPKLPRADDRFDVLVKLERRGWHLKDDGTWDQSGAAVAIPVRPKNSR